MNARKPISPEKWRHYGNAGHFICGHLCRFHLCTEVGEYLVSTVGEMWPSRASREIHASINDPKWHHKHNHLLGDNYDAAYMMRFGYEEIGAGRKYETMVFRWSGRCNSPECNCEMPHIDPQELDAEPANTAGEASVNHWRLCTKWAKRQGMPRKP